MEFQHKTLKNRKKSFTYFLQLIWLLYCERDPWNNTIKWSIIIFNINLRRSSMFCFTITQHKIIYPNFHHKFYAVKCNLTKLTTKRSWYLSSGQRSAVGRAGSVPPSVVACFSVAYRSGFVAELGVILPVFFCPPPSPSPFFHCLSQCDRCLDDCLWGLMAGLRGLPAMRAFHCLGAGWSQWRPPDIPGTYLPDSLMQ